MPQHLFEIYDFVVASDWLLPGVEPVVGRGAEVSIRAHPTPRSLDSAEGVGACFAARPGEVLLWMDGVARFRIVAGRAIEVEVASGADAAVAALLASSPMAALLLQRGLLPLEGSAVATPRGTVLLLGGAGVGKSTLAAALARRGCAVLGDDLAVVSGAESSPGVLSGGTALRLWPHVLGPLGLAGEFPALRPGVDKRVVSFPPRATTRPEPVRAIFVLGRGVAGLACAAVRTLGGAERLAAVHDLLAWPGIARGLGVDRSLFLRSAALARSVPVHRLDLPPHRLAPLETADVVLENLRG